MKPLLKNILIFAGIFIILVIVYVVFFGGTKDTSSLTTTAGTTGASTTTTSATTQSDVGKEFLATLLNLRTIKLDDSMFSNPAFVSLRDFELTLIQETNPGRPNPFLPLGVDQSVSTNQTTPTGAVPAGDSTTSTTTTDTASLPVAPASPADGTTAQ